MDNRMATDVQTTGVAKASADIRLTMWLGIVYQTVQFSHQTCMGEPTMHGHVAKD